jgi:FtsP/CotA-like multicopper oxidase with cupredoxin domain
MCCSSANSTSLFGWWSTSVKEPDDPDLFPKAYKPPTRVEEAVLTFAPEVPPPITRNYPVKLKVDMDVQVQPPSSFSSLSKVRELSIDGIHDYEFWTFNGGVPGPFIRAREGDVIEVSLTNNDASGMLHNVDFHAVSGPGGGAVVTTTDSNTTKQAYFRLDYPGLFIYHCAVAPVPVHMANGMYGLILVEPKAGLPKYVRKFWATPHRLQS